jgi:hypothetical protein
MVYTLLQPQLCIFRTFILETTDNKTGASGVHDASVLQPPVKPPERRRFKLVVTREERYGKHSGHSARSPGVNDGDIARPRVSIHAL